MEVSGEQTACLLDQGSTGAFGPLLRIVVAVRANEFGGFVALASEVKSMSTLCTVKYLGPATARTTHAAVSASLRRSIPSRRRPSTRGSASLVI